MEHTAIINQHGAVWLGKFGLGMSKKFLNIAKQQLDNGNVCTLYLMRGSKFTHRANIIDLLCGNTSKSEIQTVEQHLTPTYYNKKKCAVWFKLSDIMPFSTEEKSTLWLYNTPGAHPSTVGMRGLIYLTKENK